MNKIYTILSLLLIASFSIFAQCEYPNGDFESWEEVPASFDETNPDLTYIVETPEAHSSVVRFLFYAFGFAFGDPAAQMDYDNDPQTGYGIAKSTDAYEGQFAAKLQGNAYIEFSDIYSVYQCSEVPDSVSFQIKHVGANSDTIFFGMFFEEGLGPLPEDETDLENYPAFAQNSFVLTGNTEYERISFPIIQNFDAAIDTASMIILLTTPLDQITMGIDSYILIDDIQLKSGTVAVDELIDIQFQLYPNPANDVVNISYAGSQDQLSLTCFDVNGKQVIIKDNLKKQLDVSDLVSGLYFIKIQNKQTGASGYQSLFIQH